MRMWIVAGVLSFGLAAGLAGAAQPPPPISQPTQPRSASQGLYADSWAVIIGINRYQNPRVPLLRYAVNDARAVAQALLAQGFRPERIFLLLDLQATKGSIEGLLGDYLRAQVGPDDRLLVFFAGHGKTDRLRSGEEEGYLLPVEADPDGLFSTAIGMTALRQISDRLRAKHILFIVDACYSGYAIYNRAIADDLLEEMVKKPAIQILTAGRQGDEAQERGGHGVFTDVLLRGLQGGAFAGKGWLALEELGVWVKHRVFAESNKRQLPQYGNLSGEGQFVFLKPSVEPPAGSAPKDTQQPSVTMVPQQRAGNTLTGTFKGEVLAQRSGGQFPMPFTFTLVQNGDQVTGLWTIGASAYGTIRGIASETAVPQFRAQQINPCPGTYSGSVEIQDKGNRLRGSYSGEDCGGTVTATFSVTRQ